MGIDVGRGNSIVELNRINLENNFTNPENALQKLTDKINPKLTNEELSTITNREFLKIPKKERLQNVTNGNISYNDIINGKVKKISFFFDHNGTLKDDTDLFRKTTIGQLMGKEVSIIMCNGIEYSRSGLDGEFFNGNKRLKIYTNTEIEVVKIRDQDELIHLNERVLIDTEKYYDSLKNSQIIYGGFRRGINILAFCDIFEKILSNFSGVEYDVKLEELFTEVDRKRSRGNLGSHSEELKELIKNDNND